MVGKSAQRLNPAPSRLLATVMWKSGNISKLGLGLGRPIADGSTSFKDLMWSSEHEVVLGSPPESAEILFGAKG